MPTESRHRAATGLPGLILVGALTTWAGAAEAGPPTIRLITAPPARATTARPPPPNATPRGCHTAWHWPLHGPLTSGYGPRHHPILRRPRFHSGLDLAAPMGARVRAGAAGRVRRAGWAGGYGRLIELDHGAGWTSRYAHLHTSLVRVGQWVGAGEVIATVGATGLATGPHLHFEIRHQARALDPRTCLAAPPTQRPAAWVEGAR